MQRSDVLMDLGCTLNPVIDIGQIEGAFVQGMGWCTMEECVWGDKAHKWVRRRLCSSTGHATWWCNTPLLRVQMKPGSLLTRGPGFYKIPSFNDVPIDFRISLLADAPNPAVRVSGAPPVLSQRGGHARRCSSALRRLTSRRKKPARKARASQSL